MNGRVLQVLLLTVSFFMVPYSSSKKICDSYFIVFSSLKLNFIEFILVHETKYGVFFKWLIVVSSHKRVNIKHEGKKSIPRVSASNPVPHDLNTSVQNDVFGFSLPATDFSQAMNNTEDVILTKESSLWVKEHGQLISSASGLLEQTQFFLGSSCFQL